MRRASNNTNIKTADSIVSLPFDLATVRTKPDNKTLERTKDRIFGLQEAPTYFPTEEEFKDPLSYIEKISPEGEKYGIIKIVPPESYQPKFSLKTETFRFKTRLQKLNSMEGETRANVNYLEQLTKYHILTGKPVSKIPQLDKRPIDLYKLKNEVALRGGIQEVTRLKKWAEIGRVLGYARKQCTSMSNALKSAYTKVVLPYEIWYANHKDDVDQILKKGEIPSINNPESSSDSLDSDTCEICGKNEDEDKLLLCDGCNRGYHMYCLKPRLTSIPKTDWYCIQCLTAVGKDYGFEEGSEYDLTAFQKVCNQFKKEWFEKSLGKENPTVTEEECENEFWRLVENPHETCEVEYGADLHSTQHGSGFLTAEQMRKEAFDPWNLNVIPVAPQSLFTFIKTDISGMMIPWLYIGMCFSAFCWHNEDHYTYSINYMHWGETKTWYGIPGSDANKFEETMKKAVPELFEQQPDLLFQLVTMLSPGRLLKENVNVYAVDQRPGQFVVTFPKAYHSGFNHGFNFCEAINFAPKDWVSYGLECVKRYKEFRKQPCFSHDELLVTAAQNIQLKEKMDWLKQGLYEMQNREFKDRQLARSKKIKEHLGVQSEELQCIYCNCFTYLSYIGCKCTDKVACSDHISELCSCDHASKTLYLRFTDEQLLELIKHISNTDSSSSNWFQKLDKIMSSRPAPSLKTLKELLKEGYEANAPKDSLDTLEDYIEAAERWILEAEKLLNYKTDSSKPNHLKKNKNERAKELIDKAATIGFDLPHVDKIKTYYAKLNEFSNKLSNDVLEAKDKDLMMHLYKEGVRLRADSEQFNQLQTIIESSSWEEQAQKALESPFNLKNVRKLIKDAEDMTMKNEPLLNRLVKIEEIGSSLLQRIDNICRGKEKIEVDEEEAILQLGQNVKDKTLSIELEPHLFVRLKNNFARSKKTLKELEDVLRNKCTHPSVISRPSLTEAQRYMTLCREVCFKSDLISELSTGLTQMGKWNEKIRSAFMNGRQKSLEAVLKETLNNVQRITSSEGQAGLWCICRKAESGLMIECDICHDWYHNSCVKVPRNVVRSSNSYICPICLPGGTNKKITHLSRQPRIEEVHELITLSQNLMFCPKDYKLVLDIYKLMQDYRLRVQSFCRSRTQLGIQDIPQIKYYLRTLLGLEVALQDEMEFLRTKVEVLMPVNHPMPVTTAVLTEKASEKISIPTGLPSPSIESPPNSQITIPNLQTPTTYTLKKKEKEEEEISKLLHLDEKAPLTNNNSKNIECICKDATATDSKQKLIQCITCNHYSHQNCVIRSIYFMTSDFFKCSKCRYLENNASTSTNTESQPPRLHITAYGTKRRIEEDNEVLYKPQKIIRLTVNPPAQPTVSSLPSSSSSTQLSTPSSGKKSSSSIHGSSANSKRKPQSPLDENYKHTSNNNGKRKQRFSDEDNSHKRKQQHSPDEHGRSSPKKHRT
ncbi:uncharacterized protein BX663DRAFT_506344 [Cokeromyces recurvatus]|uniref:uncharacterized protein n=1 Tax=Cokeromyces recurvatus TaxID=90255 RepID=UPI00221F53B8|nr:uncharacterized protein BX663DRAFT_506344 [Cokeromyces recurvatus]KAI7904086.1 hypothetical protein BX663DRAFT_506344 [Cokeromyces recurvatus]